MNRTIYSVTSHILHTLHDTDNSFTKANLARLRESAVRTEPSPLVWQLLFENLPKSFLSRTGRLTHEERAILDALQLYALHQRANSKSVNVMSKTPDQTLGDFQVQFRKGKYVVKATISSTSGHHPTQYLKNIKDVQSQLAIWQRQAQEVEDKSPHDHKNSTPKNMGDSLRALRKAYPEVQPIDRRFNMMIATPEYGPFITSLRSLVNLLRSKTIVTVDYAQLAHDLYQILNSNADANQIKMNWSQSYFKFND